MLLKAIVLMVSRPVEQVDGVHAFGQSAAQSLHHIM